MIDEQRRPAKILGIEMTFSDYDDPITKATQEVNQTNMLRWLLITGNFWHTATHSEHINKNRNLPFTMP